MSTLFTEEIIAKVSDLLTGISKLGDVEVKLCVDESVTPTGQPHWWLPFHLYKETEAEFHRLLNLDITERVDDVPILSVSPITVEKNLDTHLCKHAYTYTKKPHNANNWC